MSWRRTSSLREVLHYTADCAGRRCVEPGKNHRGIGNDYQAYAHSENQAGSRLQFRPATGSDLARNRYAAEEIVGQLRPVEIKLTKWLVVVEANRKREITEQTYHRREK